MAELVYALVSEANGGNTVGVRVPSTALNEYAAVVELADTLD